MQSLCSHPTVHDSFTLTLLMWRPSMKVGDSLFIFGFVFIGIPVIGLATVFVEIFRGVL